MKIYKDEEHEWQDKDYGVLSEKGVVWSVTTSNMVLPPFEEASLQEKKILQNYEEQKLTNLLNGNKKYEELISKCVFYKELYENTEEYKKYEHYPEEWADEILGTEYFWYKQQLQDIKAYQTILSKNREVEKIQKELIRTQAAKIKSGEDEARKIRNIEAHKNNIINNRIKRKNTKKI